MFENYSWDTAFANFMDSLEVMGLGMGGVFVVMLLLMAAITILAKVTGKKKDNENK